MTKLLIRELIFGRQLGHLKVAKKEGWMEMKTLQQYFSDIHREEEPDEKQIVEIEKALEAGALGSMKEVSKWAANGIILSSGFAAEKLEILLQGGFLKYIGKNIVNSVPRSDILMMTNLGKAATKLVNRCGDLLVNLNPERVVELLMGEFKIIND